MKTKRASHIVAVVLAVFAALALFATRSLALVAQPFILGALLGMTDSFAVIVIGLLCLACAGLFAMTQSFK